MNKNHGFTIVEIVVAMAIFSLVTLILTDIFIRTYKTYEIERSQTTLQINARFALDTLSKWIKNSSEAVSSYTAPDAEIYQTDNDSLVLKVPAIDADQEIINDTYDYFVFQLSTTISNQLDKIVYANSASSRSSETKPLAQDVTTFALTYKDSSDNELTENYENTALILSNITLQEVIRAKTNQVELEIQAKLRNK